MIKAILLSVKPQDKVCKYCEITLDWGDLR